MYKLVILFFLIGCQSSVGEVQSIKIKYDEVTINAVEKELSFNVNIPENMKTSIEQWFNQKVKVNGFSGVAKFEVNKFEDQLTEISGGKKYEVKINLNIFILDNNIPSQEDYNIQINEYGTITGNFSLNDVDTMILNTQKSLVGNLSKTLNSKI